MAVIHFLNVKEGDCSVIRHDSDRISVIDVCNAKPLDSEKASQERFVKMAADYGILGNFNQKNYPVNPIAYLEDHGIDTVFRFILTHPDMDHLDGLKWFFQRFRPDNFWDTDNKADKVFEEGSPYDEEDWRFYKRLRDSNPQTDPKRLTLFSGAEAQFYRVGQDGTPGGDGLHVLAPTPELVRESNQSEDYNDCSYVILYWMATGRRVLFGGDCHDKTWDHILKTHREEIENIDLLIAPHHGRKSDRSYAFLDVLRPKMTFFGNARWKYLAYDAWNYRKLPFITNNEAGCMVVDGTDMGLYVTHKPFAEKCNPYTSYSDKFRAFYVGQIQ